MQVIYVRGHSLTGTLIRGASWWRQWSHCGVVTPENTVLNARPYYGVIEEPMADFMARYTASSGILTVNCPNDAHGLDWARSQKGAGYDYGAIRNFIFGQLGGNQDVRRYVCVEFLEMTLLNARVSPRFRVPLDEVTVQQSYITR